MDNKVILIDNGYLQHRAIFSYMQTEYSKILPIFKEENSEEKLTDKQIIKWLEEDKSLLNKYLNIIYNSKQIFFAFATYNYMNMLCSILKELKPTYEDKLFIAKDSIKGNWRKNLYEPYKSQRKKYRESKRPNNWWNKIYEVFNEFYQKLDKVTNWYFLQTNMLEADDWASSVSRIFNDKSVFLVSSDADWQQLLYFPNVKVMSIITKKYFECNNPIAILESKIEKGDSSDFIKGKPKNDEEREIRRTIINLIELPEEIDNQMRWELENLPIKNMKWELIPFPKSIRPRLYKIYEGEKK